MCLTASTIRQKRGIGWGRREEKCISLKCNNVVSMMASGTQDRGFASGRNRRIFQAKKILSMTSFGREVKPFAPSCRSAACKRSLNGVKRRHFGKITGPFSPTFPPFATRNARVDGDVEASGGESGNA
jgi:hypothetical protein